jgi:glycine cleavage system aminomethyltransferase T
LGGWPLVESFEPPEGACEIGLTDLSHLPKSVVSGPALAELGVSKPGQAVWNGRALVGCQKPGQGVVFELSGAAEPRWPDASYTDVTDGWVLLGVWGPKSPEVMQRLVTVDLEPRATDGPIFIATGSHGIRVQLVNLRGVAPGFVISCVRSHGQNLFDACIRAGRQFDLKVTGLNAFYSWLDGALPAGTA